MKPARTNSKPRPAFSPFQAETEGVPDVAANIEVINKILANGRRGGINVPTGHANAIKAAFETASDPEHPERRWTVEFMAVTPVNVTLNFHDPSDPLPTTVQTVLSTIALLRQQTEAVCAYLKLHDTGSGS